MSINTIKDIHEIGVISLFAYGVFAQLVAVMH